MWICINSIEWKASDEGGVDNQRKMSGNAFAIGFVGQAENFIEWLGYK